MNLWPHLKPGDLVDVVAPGSGAPLESIERGLEVLRSWGLQPRFPEGSLQASTFFSNQDRERLRYLRQALRAKDSKVVWCLRGGSGTHRLLPGLFQGMVRPAHRKWVIGFSDITSLHAALKKHWRWPSLHAPVVTQLGSKDLAIADKEELRRCLFGEQMEIVYDDLQALNAKARNLKRGLRGNVLGGNLTVFQTLVGTRALPGLKGSFLFFEDVGERGYRLDRTLTHLRQAGVFDQVQAVFLGDLTGGDEPAAEGKKPENRINWAIENFVQEISVPVFAGLPVGHGARNRPLPLGCSAQLRDGRLIFDLSQKG